MAPPPSPITPRIDHVKNVRVEARRTARDDGVEQRDERGQRQRERGHDGVGDAAVGRAALALDRARDRVLRDAADDHGGDDQERDVEAGGQEQEADDGGRRGDDAPTAPSPGSTLPATWTGGRTRSGELAASGLGRRAPPRWRPASGSGRSCGVGSVTSASRSVGSVLISDPDLAVDHCARGHVDHQRHGEEDETGGDQGVDRETRRTRGSRARCWRRSSTGSPSR